MNALYTAVARRAENRCEYCRAPEDVFNFAFEVEHIHPKARGGQNDLPNLALSCSACNRFKGDAVTGIDPQTEQETSLFNPREDIWAVHFESNLSNGNIRGLTPKGRVTIVRLQMNRPQQVRARVHWMQLGLYAAE